MVTTDTAPGSVADRADGLVVPGVGAFAACVRGLRDVGGAELLARRVADDRPVLGICVGMQVLFEAGDEHGTETVGLGLLPGRVESLQAERLPHMGWNQVDAAAGSALLAGIGPGTRFYFVHSYGVAVPDGSNDLITTAEHGGRFVAAIERGALRATQFHPEKSGDAGAALLSNWLQTL